MRLFGNDLCLRWNAKLSSITSDCNTSKTKKMRNRRESSSKSKNDIGRRNAQPKHN